ncbi:PHP domain-containing protein [Usitatibacter rugosus]|uniref:PHP domain-containing protein n=1 Tax=Usitatibacter rugosus TaxID=2732067 RepID=UPI003CCE2BAE
MLSPTQLMELAAKCGVDAIALTDHDTTDGLAEARVAAERVGVKLVNGVEISVSWGKTTLHVVGLAIDPDNPVLSAGLQAIRAGRLTRAHRIAEALANLGIPDTLAPALALAKNESMVSRTHFARHLAASGKVKNIQAAFDKYLAKGKPAYVSHEWASLKDAIDWIKAAGGTAVLAHPGRYDLKPAFRNAMLEEFRSLGGEAIEVVTGSHRPEQYATWRRIAEEHGFLASRGADYHGPGESPYEPGKLPMLPVTCKPVWSKWTH